MSINLKYFWKFCKHFDLASGISLLTSARDHIKENSYVYRFLFLSAICGQKSFLQIDHWGRLASNKKLFRLKRYRNRRYQHTVVSDSTMITRLGELVSNELRLINYRVLKRGIEWGFIKKIAIVDGSWLGKRLYSVLGFVTKWGDIFLVDVEPLSGRGKEPLGSERLLRRFHRMCSEVGIDYLVVDALYFTERFYRLYCQGVFKQLVIKYTPDEEKGGAFRRVLERFEELVAIYEFEHRSRAQERLLQQMGFRYQQGYDKSSGEQYRIYIARSNSYDRRYQIARVMENKAGQDGQVFYVITTDKSLDGKQMRQLARRRWYIENDGFKTLNNHIHSKRIWTQGKVEHLNLLLIQILSFSLLMLFRKEYGYKISRIYKSKKITLSFVARILFDYSYLGAHWLES